MAWETECAKYGIPTIAYSFHNHVQEGANPKILTLDELKEGWEHVEQANERLERQIDHLPFYVKNLLSRNWFQVKNSEIVYAIGKWHAPNVWVVDGGTGWATQMAIDNQKPCFFFEQAGKQWYSYEYIEDGFIPIDGIPDMTHWHFAGVGTRDLTDDGKQAIIEILKYNFS